VRTYIYAKIKLTKFTYIVRVTSEPCIANIQQPETGIMYIYIQGMIYLVLQHAMLHAKGMHTIAGKKF